MGATSELSEGPAARSQLVKDAATGWCIVGGGPAGAMLALLLARRGVHVTLLEMHHDFDRGEDSQRIGAEERGGKDGHKAPLNLTDSGCGERRVGYIGRADCP